MANNDIIIYNITSRKINGVDVPMVLISLDVYKSITGDFDVLNTFKRHQELERFKILDYNDKKKIKELEEKEKQLLEKQKQKEQQETHRNKLDI
jgi:hypothetical protein